MTGTKDVLLRLAADVPGWLGFAAAPTFALMAGISSVGAPGMSTCYAASPFVPINEMGLMYLLMSFFHLSPWLRFLSRRRAAPHHAIIQMQGV